MPDYYKLPCAGRNHKSFEDAECMDFTGLVPVVIINRKYSTDKMP